LIVDIINCLNVRMRCYYNINVFFPSLAFKSFVLDVQMISLRNLELTHAENSVILTLKKFNCERKRLIVSSGNFIFVCETYFGQV